MSFGGEHDDLNIQFGVTEQGQADVIAQIEAIGKLIDSLNRAVEVNVVVRDSEATAALAQLTALIDGLRGNLTDIPVTVNTAQAETALAQLTASALLLRANMENIPITANTAGLNVAVAQAEVLATQLHHQFSNIPITFAPVNAPIIPAVAPGETVVTPVPPHETPAPMVAPTPSPVHPGTPTAVSEEAAVAVGGSGGAHWNADLFRQIDTTDRRAVSGEIARLQNEIALRDRLLVEMRALGMSKAQTAAVTGDIFEMQPQLASYRGVQQGFKNEDAAALLARQQQMRLQSFAFHPGTYGLVRSQMEGLQREKGEISSGLSALTPGGDAHNAALDRIKVIDNQIKGLRQHTQELWNRDFAALGQANIPLTNLQAVETKLRTLKREAAETQLAMKNAYTLGVGSGDLSGYYDAMQRVEGLQHQMRTLQDAQALGMEKAVGTTIGAPMPGNYVGVRAAMRETEEEAVRLNAALATAVPTDDAAIAAYTRQLTLLDVRMKELQANAARLRQEMSTGMNRGLEHMGAGWQAGQDVYQAKYGAIGGLMGRVGTVGLYGGAIGAALEVGTGIVAGRFEQQKIAMQTLLGDKKKADALMEELKRYEPKIPYSFPSLVQFSRQLMAAGFSKDQIIPVFQAIGDTASALGAGEAGLSRFVQGIMEIKNGGPIGRELMRIAQDVPGFNPRGVIIKAFGSDLGIKDVTKMTREDKEHAGERLDELIRKHRVNRDAMVQGMVDQMEQDHGGAMARQMGTLQGQFTNLITAAWKVSLVLGDEFLPGIKSAVGALKGLLNAFNSADEETKRTGAQMLGLGTGVALLAGVLGKVVPLIMQLGSGMAALPTLLAMFSGGAGLAGAALGTFTMGILTVIAALGALAIVVDGVRTVFEVLNRQKASDAIDRNTNAMRAGQTARADSAWAALTPEQRKRANTLLQQRTQERLKRSAGRVDYGPGVDEEDAHLVRGDIGWEMPRRRDVTITPEKPAAHETLAQRQARLKRDATRSIRANSPLPVPLTKDEEADLKLSIAQQVMGKPYNPVLPPATAGVSEADRWRREIDELKKHFVIPGTTKAKKAKGTRTAADRSADEDLRAQEEYRREAENAARSSQQGAAWEPLHQRREQIVRGRALYGDSWAERQQIALDQATMELETQQKVENIRAKAAQETATSTAHQEPAVRRKTITLAANQAVREAEAELRDKQLTIRTRIETVNLQSWKESLMEAAGSIWLKNPAFLQGAEYTLQHMASGARMLEKAAGPAHMRDVLASSPDMSSQLADVLQGQGRAPGVPMAPIGEFTVPHWPQATLPATLPAMTLPSSTTMSALPVTTSVAGAALPSITLVLQGGEVTLRDLITHISSDQVDAKLHYRDVKTALGARRRGARD